MQVVQVKLNGGAVGGLCDPDVEILALAGFEEEDIVAVVEVCKFVELVELGFGVELCVFATMGEEGMEIVKEMSMSGKAN